VPPFTAAAAAWPEGHPATPSSSAEGDA